jgi:tetratricopeptide (TPR) repeat protein
MPEDAGVPIEEARGELSMARIALAENDLHHAANHLAGALGHSPDLAEVHEMLAELAARCADGGLGLFPLGQHVFVGTVVAHAHLLAPSEPGAALELLAQATAHDPSKPWADTLWVRRLDVPTVDPDTLVRTFVGVMQVLGEPVDAQLREANDVYLHLARRAVEAYPEHGLLHGAAAGLGRRLSAQQLAVSWGERGWRLDPSKLTAVWYAYALRAAGRLDAGLEVMRDASERNPLDLDLCADIANWLAEAGRLDQALAVLDDALRTDPSYDCAVHTAQRLRYQRDGDVNHLVALVDFIRANPIESHEHRDLADSCRQRYWLGVVTQPTEACVNVLAQVPHDKRGELVTLALSGLEVPSALALLRRECPDLQVEIEGPPFADMVNPLRPGRQLWRYDGMTAHPAVDVPSAAAIHLLADTATPVWQHPVAAYDRALPLGQLPATQLLSLLVHPPARPDQYADLPDGYWERASQVFACLGILHCVELGGPTPGDDSARRRLLTEVAFGVEDWTVEAALFALTVAAWLDPACRQEVRDTVGQRFLSAVEASRVRPVTILPSLAAVVRIVPGMPREVTELAEKVLEAERDGERSDDPADRPARSPKSAGGWRAATKRPALLPRLFGRRRRQTDSA